MDPVMLREWAAALLPYLGLFTAFWAIHTYRRGKKVEVARLQKQIFDDLYLSGKFEDIRILLDMDYAAAVEPLLRKALPESTAVIEAEERKTLIKLDNFLNLVEYVLYLEQDAKLIKEKDRRALLSYWLNAMRAPDKAVLQQYISKYDYERLAACVTSESEVQKR